MSEQNILATIDGVNITDADLDAYIANLPKEQQAYAAYPQFSACSLNWGYAAVQRACTEAASGIPSVCKDGRRRKNG